MSAAARVYAKAFFSAAREGAGAALVLSELKEFNAALLSTPAMRSIFSFNAVNAGSRKKVLVEILREMKLGEQAKKMLVLLSERGRLGELSLIIAEVERLIDEDAGVRRGSLLSAIALDNADVENLTLAIAKKLKVKVKLDAVVDTGLLGGFVATVSGKTFDASLKTQLNKIRDSILG